MLSEKFWLFLFVLLHIHDFLRESLCKVISLFHTPSLIQKFGKKYVVITGATSGIGKAIATQCAKEGMDLFLVSRDAGRLNDTKQEIQSKYERPITIKTYAIDFSTYTPAQLKDLKKELDQLEIGIFVHSAGISYPSAQKIEEISEELVDHMLSINLKAAIHLTQAILPAMRKQKSGALVFIGSGASVLPTEPLYAAYVASKGGLEKFSESLQAECYHQNVIVQYQCPLLVATKLSKIRRTSLAVLSPERFANDSIRAIKTSTASINFSTRRCPSLVHAIIIMIANIMPFGLWTLIRLGMTSRLRRRYIEKSKRA